MEKFFFLHIPRTGGISLVQTFKAMLGPQAVSPHGNDATIKQLLSNEYGLYCGHFTARSLKHLNSDFITMTILRDPADHAFSLYNHLRTLRRTSKNAALIDASNSMDFTGFVESNEPAIMVYIRNPLVAALAIDKSLPEAKNTIDAMDFVGATEHYDQVLEWLESRLGKPAPRNIRANATPMDRKHQQIHREAVYRSNPLDVALYQYAKARFHPGQIYP